MGQRDVYKCGSVRYKRFCSEFAFFVGRHKGGREAESSKAQASLRTSANVMDYGNRSLVEFFLVVVLVLDHIDVHEIADVCARVPAHIIGIHIHLP